MFLIYIHKIQSQFDIDKYRRFNNTIYVSQNVHKTKFQRKYVNIYRYKLKMGERDRCQQI